MSTVLLRGNALHLPIADGVIQCCATSPPYFGLRNYQLPPTAWPAVAYAPMPGLPPVEIPAMACCLGLESSPEAFIGHLVLVYREVWRVLRSDGVAWVNMGDSYASSGKASGVSSKSGLNHGDGVEPGQKSSYAYGRAPTPESCKPKDLLGIPWRLSFALQADGWYLRSDVIWSKPSPMPESVTDRPTKSHEYIFLMTKQPRYFYDNEAIKEKDSGKPSGNGFTREHRLTYQNPDGSARGNPEQWEPGSGRNKRTVWTYASAPEKSAHFACWPPALVTPMVKAGTSERGCCPKCRAPWVRVIEKDRQATRPGVRSKVYATAPLDPESPYRAHNGDICGNRDPQRHTTATRTIGWEPGCTCNAGEPIPCTVLDIFNGSGTTGEVCALLDRDYLGVDLNPAYLSDIALGRIERGERPHATVHKSRRSRGPGDLPLFGEVEAPAPSGETGAR